MDMRTRDLVLTVDYIMRGGFWGGVGRGREGKGRGGKGRVIGWMDGVGVFVDEWFGGDGNEKDRASPENRTNV